MTDEIPAHRLPDDMAPEVAAVVFATEYDRSIQRFAGILDTAFGTFEEDRDASLEQSKGILQRLVPLPENLTVEASMPYVELSDLLYLGLLTHRFLVRLDEDPEVGL